MHGRNDSDPQSVVIVGILQFFSISFLPSSLPPTVPFSFPSFLAFQLLLPLPAGQSGRVGALVAPASDSSCAVHRG